MSEEVNKELERLEFPQIFEEDVVCPVNRPKKIGVVSAVQWESDSDESDSEEDEDDEEDSEEEQELGPNQVRVEWVPTRLSNTVQDDDFETAEDANKLIVIDRALLHGDIVAWASDPYGQTGTVIEVELEVDLEFSTSEQRKDVSSRHIKHIHPFIADAYVVKGSWIGRISMCHVDLVVHFPDGASCVLKDVPPLAKDGYPFSDSEDYEASDCMEYFPSMALKVNTLGRKVFRRAKWLQGSFHPSRKKCVITEVIPTCVEVEWIATTNAINEGEWDPPDEENDPSTLLVLDHFEMTKWQVGDIALCDPAVRTGDNAAGDTDESSATTNNSNNSTITTTTALPQPSQQQRNLTKREKQKLKKARQRQKKKASPVQNTSIIRCTHTKVTVMWQDRTIERGIEAKLLVPVKNLLDSDFWPEDFVVRVSPLEDDNETSTKDDSATPETPQLPNIENLQSKGLVVKKIDSNTKKPQRLGIIRRVDAASRTCVVRWLDREVVKEKQQEGKKTKKWEGEEEEVSFYEIMCYPDFNSSIGTVVLRLPSPGETVEEAHDSKQDSSENQGLASNSKNEEKGGKIVSRPQPKNKKRGSQRTSNKGAQIEELGDDEFEDFEPKQKLSKNQRKKAQKKGSQRQQQGQGKQQQIEDDGEKEKDKEKKEKEDTDEEETAEKPVGAPKHGWVGMITKIKGGQLQIMWADKKTSWLDIDAVYAIDSDDEDDDFESDWESDEDDEEDEDGEEREPPAITSSDPIRRSFDSTITEKKKWWSEDNDSILGFPSQRNLPSSPVAHSSPSHTTTQRNTTTPTAPSRRGNQVEEESEASISDISDEESEDETSVDKNDNDEEEEVDDMASFGIFGAQSETGIRCMNSHKFKDEPHQPVELRRWTAAVLKDWNVLKRSLPAGIVVRTFANRMDLVKVLIIGPRNTPYANSAFAFDIQLPPSYPDVPPYVHYCSLLNERLNPNLYETGKVCLSLLGTWVGSGVETWNPSESNLLQVIVSIQGLILGTAEPYYLEAGYDKYKGTAMAARSSKLYNESAYLLCLRHMTQMILRPPCPFEKYVKAHFFATGKEIIEACQYFLQMLEEEKEKEKEQKQEQGKEKEKEKEKEGESKEKQEKKTMPPLVPDDDKDEKKALPPVLLHRPSRGFCRTLATIFPKLLKALEDLQSQQQQN